MSPIPNNQPIWPSIRSKVLLSKLYRDLKNKYFFLFKLANTFLLLQRTIDKKLNSKLKFVKHFFLISKNRQTFFFNLKKIALHFFGVSLYF